MKYELAKSIIFSDTQIPDIFLAEYLPEAEGDYVKVYLYCVFLSKHKKQVPIGDLSKKLCMDINKVKEAITYWETLGVLIRAEGGITFCDLKEREVHKLYRPKLTSSPEETKASAEKNMKRSQVITAINNTFFQGIMAPSWYMDIDMWLDKYGFEEDVMLTMFKYCYDKNKLARSYINAVAENWYKKGIVNSFDLDKAFAEYEKCDEIKKKLSKKLSIYRPLTQYEEAYIEKWSINFGYNFDLIEVALRKTTSKTNPNFDYLDKIITEWNNVGVKTVEEAQNQIKNHKQATKKETEKTLPNKFKGQAAKNIDYSKFYYNA